MSRSIKKHPYITENSRSSISKEKKRKANKRVRKADIASGASFKKVSNSYDINDYSFYLPKDPKAKRK